MTLEFYVAAMDYQTFGSAVARSKICIAFASLGLCPAFQRLYSFRLVGEDLDLLSAPCADESSIAD